jgi:hypothetical protein
MFTLCFQLKRNTNKAEWIHIKNEIKKLNNTLSTTSLLKTPFTAFSKII